MLWSAFSLTDYTWIPIFPLERQPVWPPQSSLFRLLRYPLISLFVSTSGPQTTCNEYQRSQGAIAGVAGSVQTRHRTPRHLGKEHAGFLDDFPRTKKKEKVQLGLYGLTFFEAWVKLGMKWMVNYLSSHLVFLGNMLNYIRSTGVTLNPGVSLIAACFTWTTQKNF